MAEPRTHRWGDLPIETLKPGLTPRLISGDRVMLAQVLLTEGTEVPRHHHHNEQISYILEGATQIYFGPHDEQTHIVRAGEAVVTPSNLPHCAVALEDTVDVDVSRHQGTTGCTEPTPICAANDNAADHGAGDKP